MEFRPMTCFWNNLLSGQKMGNENILNVSGSKKTTVLLSTMFYTLFIDVVLCCIVYQSCNDRCVSCSIGTAIYRFQLLFSADVLIKSL